MQIAHATGGGSAAASAAPARDGRRRRWFESKTVTRDQLLAITRELATLLRAGLTLDRALEILIGLAPTPAVAMLLQNVRDDVRGGKALSQALDARREIFSRFYVNIVRAGEAGGALGVVLQRLADTMERNKELRESVKSALFYPVILVFVAVASVALLLVWVVPQFEATFAQAGKALPLPTLVVVSIGKFMRGWWWAVDRRRRARGPVVSTARPQSGGAHRARPAEADAAAAGRPAREAGDRAFRADARDAARQRRDAAGRALHREGDDVQRGARGRARRRDREAARRQGLRPAAGRDRAVSKARQRR